MYRELRSRKEEEKNKTQVLRDLVRSTPSHKGVSPFGTTPYNAIPPLRVLSSPHIDANEDAGLLKVKDIPLSGFSPSWKKTWI